MRAVLALFALALPACTGDKGASHRRGNPGEDFTWSDSVRVTSPANGETVEPTFTVSFTAGEDVDSVRLDADGAAVTSLDSVEGGGDLVVTLEEGRHSLRLVGLDSGGGELSQHSLAVRVAGEESPWVTITSPSDGAEVTNPVTFAVSASEGVDTVELLADDWPIGTVEPGGILTYEFEGTGYERTIEAVAYDGDDPVAEDGITITVEPGTEPEESEFNDAYVKILESYPTDGTHGYYWPSSGDWAGTTRDVWYLDELVAEGDPEGRCYCVGLTWEVFMRAFDEVDRETGGDGTINGMEVDDLYEFRADWYVRDLWGDGVVSAMENYGIGDPVTDWTQVKKGDIVQFWRHSGSGHSVVFIDWETDSDGDIIGLTYWSTQSSTDGIDYNDEYFGSSGSSIDPSYFFVARARMPVDWDPWR